MPIKIFIDQGHNPVNPNAGAEAFGVREQDVNYEVGVRLAALLNSNPNFEARLSRNSPTEQLGTSTNTSLQTRARMANDWGADFFISLHCNSSSNPEASGSEAYVYSFYTPAHYMAIQVLNGLNYFTQLPNRHKYRTICAESDGYAVFIGGNGVSDEYHRCLLAFYGSREFCKRYILWYSNLLWLIKMAM